jgi:uncharacterized protein YdhG (YjbR/CyaY superfamily)
MATEKKKFQTPEEYLTSLPKESQAVLRQVQKTIQEAVPDAEEVISYNIPAFKTSGWVFYYSAYTKHFSLSCPPPFTVFDEFKKELAPYKLSKSTIQFPFDKPFPGKLIADMAKFRAKEMKKAKK